MIKLHDGQDLQIVPAAHRFARARILGLIVDCISLNETQDLEAYSADNTLRFQSVSKE